MAFAMSASLATTSAFMGAKVTTKARRTQKQAKIVPSAKYGDESVYFDLDDIDNSTGNWDMYSVDASKRYPDRQSEFFERAADGLNRREAMLGFLAMGGSAACLLFGAKGAADSKLPITLGPQKAQELGPRGKL